MKKPFIINRENGGAIIRERLSGRLAVTRAFGDFELKKEVKNKYYIVL